MMSSAAKQVFICPCSLPEKQVAYQHHRRKEHEECHDEHHHALLADFRHKITHGPAENRTPVLQFSRLDFPISANSLLFLVEFFFFGKKKKSV
jgi:hypothetical protein